MENSIINLLLYNFAVRTENLDLMYKLEFTTLTSIDYKKLYELELAKWSFWSDSGTAARCVFCGERIKEIENKTVKHLITHTSKCPFYLLQHIDFTN